MPAGDGCFIPTWPTVMSARKPNASKLGARWMNPVALAQDSSVFLKNRKDLLQTSQEADAIYNQ
jgi:hypothetical protein